MRLRSMGFTLLELLVVISIIGILVALGAVSYTTAQQKGRDALRTGDMKAVQNAFEQYYAANGTYIADCLTMASGSMPAGLPSDPKPLPHPGYNVVCAPDTYCACAQLEVDDGNANASSCAAGSFVPGGFFCATNLQ